MKKIIALGLVFIGLFLSAPLSAQTVDDVIDRYYSAVGGKDNWRSVKSSLAEITFKQMGLELECLIFSQHPDINYNEVNFNGKRVIQAYDGEHAWTLNPFMGTTKPTLLEGADADQLKESGVQEPILDYRSKGHTAEYRGKGTIEGVTCHKVLLTRSDGQEVTYFFDEVNGLKVAETVKLTEGAQAGTEMQTIFTEYQFVSDGLYMPFNIKQKSEGQVMIEMVVKSYSLNVDFDKSKYTFPGN